LAFIGGAETIAARRSIAYDAKNRPVTVTLGAGTSATVTSTVYGPDGERLKRTVAIPTSGTTPASTTVTWFLGPDLEREAGVWTKIPHPDARIVGTTGATTCWVHRDQLASVAAETDATGNMKLEKRYGPYGEEKPGSTTPTGCGLGETRGYIGERADAESGLLYLHARWYDPEIGRFLTPDWWDPVDPEAATTGPTPKPRLLHCPVQQAQYRSHTPAL
jgi:RHS repeat-associated protein